MCYYVYIYLNKLKPRKFKYKDLYFEYEPFYVGKGKRNRYLHHLNKVKNDCKYKNSLKFELIKENLNSGSDPIIIKISDNLTEIDSLSLEKETIMKIGRLDINTGPLTNRNDGGIKPQDNYHHNLESKNKISESSKNRDPEKRYNLISPNGDLYENIKLLNFCKENNLDYQKMRKSSNKGKILIRPTSINQSKLETINCVGWEVINKKIYNEKTRRVKYRLISPNDQEYIIYGDQIASDIIDNLNLDFRLLRLYRNKGKIKIRNIYQCVKIESINCDGWQFIDPNRDEYIDEFKSNRVVCWRITSPEKNIYLISNLKKFCNDENLSERTFRTFKNRGVINMRNRKNYNDKVLKSFGWKCESI